MFASHSAGIALAAAVAMLAQSAGDPPAFQPADPPTQQDCLPPNPGPDVIIGDLQSVTAYSHVGDTVAFSIGTYACNIGDTPVNWQPFTELHPVLPQAIYRYAIVDGASRFEQLGISWCKHAFTALSDSLCCTCTGPGGAQLGVGCADAYSSARNGAQLTTIGGLGPRFDVNPHTGVFNFPYPFRNTNGSTPLTSISRRVQVAIADLDPALNPGAIYVAEAQYITQDDAAARNQDNNCAHRRLDIQPSGANFAATFFNQPGTVRTQPAIKAWHTLDPAVAEAIIDIPEENFPPGSGNVTGRAILAACATPLSNGAYRYEYALFNMNSDRAIASIRIPLANAVAAQNFGFHDVPHHSGDGFNSTPESPVNFDDSDWQPLRSSNAITWQLTPAAPVENSNALRWGTLYNFRFDANVPPATGDATIGIFKQAPGLPDFVTADTVIPGVPCNAPTIANLRSAKAACLTPWISRPPAASGGLPPYTWSFPTPAPQAMSIDPATGVITWPAPVASTLPYTIALQVTDAADCLSPAASFQLLVSCAPSSPLQTITPLRD